MMLGAVAIVESVRRIAIAVAVTGGSDDVYSQRDLYLGILSFLLLSF